MKIIYIRILSVFLFISLAAPSWAAWSLLPYFVRSGGQNSLLPELFSGEPIKACVKLESDNLYVKKTLSQAEQEALNNSQKKKKKKKKGEPEVDPTKIKGEELRQYIFKEGEASVNHWLSRAREVIPAQRKAEFATFLNLLPSSATMTEDCDNPTIVFYFKNRNTKYSAERSYTTLGDAFSIREQMPFNINLFLNEHDQTKVTNVFRHEMGHILGLADEYTDNGDRICRANVCTVEKKKDGHVIESYDKHIWNSNSIMMDKAVQGKATVHDVEGFINAVEFYFLNTKKQEVGLENGWELLCEKGFYYYHGEIVHGKDNLELLKQNGSVADVTNRLRALDTKLKKAREKVKSKKEEFNSSLNACSQPFDDSCLMLSAQVHYLENRINTLDSFWNQVVSMYNLKRSGKAVSMEQVQKIEEKINNSPYGPDKPMFVESELNKSTPLPSHIPYEYPRCLVCGKAIHEDVSLSGTASVPDFHFYKHEGCKLLKGVAAKRKNSYTRTIKNDKIPTYAELKVKSNLGNLTRTGSLSDSMQKGATNTSSSASSRRVNPTPANKGDSGAVQGLSSHAKVALPAKPVPVAEGKNMAVHTPRARASKSVLDKYIQQTPSLQQDLRDIHAGHATAEQIKRVQEYQRLFGNYKCELGQTHYCS